MGRADATAISRQLLAAVFFTAVAVYCVTLGNGFVWDDITHIVAPGPLQSLKNIPFFFKTAVTAGAAFEQAVPYYRPLSTLSLALDYALWGANPFGFHLTNILLHGLVSLLVTLLGFELLRSRSGALIAGLLFAVHPVHAEAVAYLATRNELLCTLFALGAFFCYCRYRDRRSWYFWPLVLTLFFASLLSKEMTVTLPVLIFLAEILCFRSNFLRALGRSVPFVLTAVFFLALRSAALVITSWESPPFGVRLATALTLLGDYLRLLVVPWPLRVLHDVPVRWSFSDPAVLVWGGLLVGLLVLLVVCCRKYPLVSFGGVWVLLTLLPVSGLPAFIQPALIAERYLYFPSVGISLLAGLVVITLRQQEWYCRRQRLLKAVGGTLLLCCGLFAGWQGRAWHDEEQFYKKMIADAPAHPLGYHELGNWYGKQQRYAEMASVYRIALDLTMQQQDQAGRAYLARGEFVRAEQEYLRLVDAKATSGAIYNNLGLACMGQGKQAEALRYFRLAVEYEPENAEFRYNLQRLEPETGR